MLLGGRVNGLEFRVEGVEEFSQGLCGVEESFTCRVSEDLYES